MMKKLLALSLALILALPAAAGAEGFFGALFLIAL